MKRIVLVLAVLLTGFQSDTIAQKIRAEFDMARFISPTDGPYLETYLKLKGNSLAVVSSNEGFHSEVIISYVITNGKDTAFADRFKLTGPQLQNDSSRMDFIDVQRIPLATGDYQLTFTLKDVNDPSLETVSITQPVAIRAATNKLKDRFRQTNYAASAPETPQGDGPAGLGNPIDFYFSDIQIVDEFRPTTSPNILSKSGKDIIPYASSFYPETRNELAFYCEVYNTKVRAEMNMRELSNLFKDKGHAHKFIILLSIEDSETGKVMQDLAARMIRDSSEVIPVLHSFDIQSLPTGNYDLAIELRDFNNELLDRRSTVIQRFNGTEEYIQPQASGLSADQEIELTFVGKYNRLELLEEYVRCLHPISSQEEIFQVNQRMNYNDATMMKRFLYYFWKGRYPDDPEGAWLKYWAEVEKVNASYSTNLKKGYDTDRGRVYLQYGAPNTISPNYFEPNTYPYEIWHYYVLQDNKSADQSNRKFVFANMDRGNSEFELIHSDAKNEITNSRWNHDLHSRSSQSVNLDVEDSGDQYGGRSKDFFENPY